MATPVKYRNGLIGTILFHVMLMFLLLFMAFKTPLPLPAEQGILVDFGNSDFGFGDFEPQMNDPAPVQPQPVSNANIEPQQNLTQDFEETAALPDNIVKKPTPETPVKQTPTETTRETAPVEEPKPVERTVDQRAMFPGRGDASSTATSQGEAGGQGNQGVPAGAPGVFVYGEGIDVGGGLEGRGIVGGMPRPDYNVQDQGVVVVTVTVDKDGKVTRATTGARGTTTLNEALLAAAQRAALQTKFSPNPNRIEQKGTITYTFKLKGE